MATRSIMHWLILTIAVRQQFDEQLSLPNSLMGTRNYSATSNNMKSVHWPLMGRLLHLVQRGGDWAEPQAAQAYPRCTKCNSPPAITLKQCEDHSS